MPAKQQTKVKRKLAESEESVGITSVDADIVPIPLNFSDDEKWMYLDFRSEMRSLINWESVYSYHWMDYVLQMMTGCDTETLTMPIENHDENMVESAIERLIKRQQYNKAFKHISVGPGGTHTAWVFHRF